jgi:hypothetical protein
MNGPKKIRMPSNRVPMIARANRVGYVMRSLKQGYLIHSTRMILGESLLLLDLITIILF